MQVVSACFYSRSYTRNAAVFEAILAGPTPYGSTNGAGLIQLTPPTLEEKRHGICGFTSTRDTLDAFAPQGVHPLWRVSILVVAQAQLTPRAMTPGVHFTPMSHQGSVPQAHRHLQFSTSSCNKRGWGNQGWGRGGGGVGRGLQ